MCVLPSVELPQLIRFDLTPHRAYVIYGVMNDSFAERIETEYQLAEIWLLQEMLEKADRKRGGMRL